VCDVHADTGREQVVKCLIDVRRLFVETGDDRYVLNDLYIDDYTAWTQHIRWTLLLYHRGSVTLLTLML